MTKPIRHFTLADQMLAAPNKQLRPLVSQSAHYRRQPPSVEIANYYFNFFRETATLLWSNHLYNFNQLEIKKNTLGFPLPLHYEDDHSNYLGIFSYSPCTLYERRKANLYLHHKWDASHQRQLVPDSPATTGTAPILGGLIFIAPPPSP